MQLGQPVRIGADSALRLCLSMPLIARAARDDAGMQAVLRDGDSVIAALEKAAATVAPDRRAG